MNNCLQKQLMFAYYSDFRKIYVRVLFYIPGHTSHCCTHSSVWGNVRLEWTVDCLGIKIEPFLNASKKLKCYRNCVFTELLQLCSH